VHLAQQTILVVMMVVFSSTLVMAAGLVLALRANEAGRLWAVGHVIASGAGLVVAASASAGSAELGALGAGAYVIGRLTIYRGVRVYYGMSEQAALLHGVGFVALVLLMLLTGLPDGSMLMHGLAYGLLALISFSTVITMLRSAAAGASAARWCWLPTWCC
jgi:hypothetical protein